MYNKEQALKEHLAKPIIVGDGVDFIFEYTTEKTEQVGRGKLKKWETVLLDVTHNGSGTVEEIRETDEHGLLYKVDTGSTRFPSEVKLVEKGYGKWVKAEWCTPSTFAIGYNPFTKVLPRINFMKQDIEQLITRTGYGRRSSSFDVLDYTNFSEKEFEGCTYGGVNFDPYVLDKEGNKVYYQRGLVWSLEQKQLLINSIYNGAEIGKFIFKYHSWNNIMAQVKETGHGYNYDMVDGKQRINALLDFIHNKFTDTNGNYWSDFSEKAQRKFLNYNNLTIGEMEENTKDSEILMVFNMINDTGIPMSKEHLNFVQSIQTKE